MGEVLSGPDLTRWSHGKISQGQKPKVEGFKAASSPVGLEVNCHIVLKNSKPITNVDNAYTIYKQNVAFHFNYFMQRDGSTRNFMLYRSLHIYYLYLGMSPHGASIVPFHTLMVLRPTLLPSKKKIPQLDFLSLPVNIPFLPQSIPKHAEAT